MARPRLTKGEDGLILEVSVTNTDIFREALDMLAYAYKKLPELEKEEVYRMLDQLLGR